MFLDEILQTPLSHQTNQKQIPDQLENHHHLKSQNSCAKDPLKNHQPIHVFDYYDECSRQEMKIDFHDQSKHF